MGVNKKSQECIKQKLHDRKDLSCVTASIQQIEWTGFDKRYLSKKSENQNVEEA